MHLSVASRWLAVSCLVWLAACGGDGGGAGSGGSDNSGSGGQQGTHLSISVDSPTLTVTQYTTAPLVISGTLSPRPTGGTIYVSVSDSNTTFYAKADIAGADTQFTATVHSGLWLDAGAHSGTLTVKICDSQDCSSAYPGYTATKP